MPKVPLTKDRENATKLQNNQQHTFAAIIFQSLLVRYVFNELSQNKCYGQTWATLERIYHQKDSITTAVCNGNAKKYLFFML